MNDLKVLSHDPEETLNIAAKFARYLKGGDIVFLKGDLGAGKTTFTKGLALGLGITPHEVNSPTFILMNFYEGKLPVYHFDFYRLTKANELATVEMDEYFYGNGVSVIEWPQRLGGLAPKEFFEVILKHKGEQQRAISFSAVGPGYTKRLKEIRI